MTTTALVWLVVGLLSLVAVLGRAAGRFRDEVGPLTQEIGELADAASDRSRGMPRGSRSGP